MVLWKRPFAIGDGKLYAFSAPPRNCLRVASRDVSKNTFALASPPPNRDPGDLSGKPVKLATTRWLLGVTTDGRLAPCIRRTTGFNAFERNRGSVAIFKSRGRG